MDGDEKIDFFFFLLNDDPVNSLMYLNHFWPV